MSVGVFSELYGKASGLVTEWKADTRSQAGWRDVGESRGQEMPIHYGSESAVP